MGKKNIEIAKGKEETIQALKKAYSSEMSAFHYWFYVAQYAEGIGFLYTDFFTKSSESELGHAKKIAQRLQQLGDAATDDPAQWESQSGIGKLEPSKHLTLKKTLEQALEFERYIIGLYDDLANKTSGKDNVTYNLALELVEDEAGDEQDIEDILSKLELQSGLAASAAQT